MEQQARSVPPGGGIPQHPMALGSQIGPYRIVGELGGGGMGLVYRAVHAQLDRPTALKVLRPELGYSAWALDRFLNEARAASAIRHPSIVDVYDYGIMPSGRPFIAMELLEGMTLGRRLARDRMSPLDAAQIAHQIAGALAAAHERGIVHSDLKPDNLFLVRDPQAAAHERIKLLDFGIARRKGEPLCHEDIVLGTPAYMAPEQCGGDGDCDHRADLYALGCILVEMLTGRPPYGLGPAVMLSAAHLVAPIPDLAGCGDVPRELALLVTALLAKHPDERPDGAPEVIALLERLLTGRDAGARGDREPAGPRDVLEAGDGLRLARGTARRAHLDSAPTEPMPPIVEPAGRGLRSSSAEALGY